MQNKTTSNCSLLASDVEAENVVRGGKGFVPLIAAKLATLTAVKPPSAPTTLYFDTADHALWRGARMTLRHRPERVRSDGLVYPQKIGIKYCAAGLQAVAQDLASQMRGSSMFLPPTVRVEAERSYAPPVNASELRMGDFPRDIRAIIRDRISFGGQHPDDVVFKPQFITQTERHHYEMIAIDGRLVAAPAKQQPRQPGRHVGFEFVIDYRLIHYLPRSDDTAGTIAENVDASRHGFRRFRKLGGPQDVAEFEAVPELSGLDARNEDVIAGHLLIEDLLIATQAELTLRCPNAKPLEAWESKGATGFSLLGKYKPHRLRQAQAQAMTPATSSPSLSWN